MLRSFLAKDPLRFYEMENYIYSIYMFTAVGVLDVLIFNI